MENKPQDVIEERNATLDEDTPIVTDSDELRDELLEESGMNGFQKFIAKMDDAKWLRAQTIAGAVLGLIASGALFWDSINAKNGNQSGSIFTAPLIVAIVVALIVPNIIEKQGGRRAPRMRIAMVCVLLVAIVGFVVYTAATKGFH